MTLQHIRDGMSSQSGKKPRLSAIRIFSHLAFAVYLFVFVSDTLNLDVIYASLFGKITFVDDAAISDSLFDTGSGFHRSVFEVRVKTNRHLDLTSNAKAVTRDDLSRINTVYEDEDSPGIEDAQTSSVIASEIILPRPESDLRIHSTSVPIDRVISFGQFLI